MTKLVVTDIDGTLVPEGSMMINPEYYKEIERLTDQGVIFVVASGRHIESIRKAFGCVLDKVWVISQNGAVLSHKDKSEVLKPIPREWIHEFWNELSGYDKVESILDTADQTYCPFHGTDMYHIILDDYQYKIDATGGWDQIPDEEFSMMTIYHPDSAEDICKPEIFDHWSGRMNLFPTGKFWVDCVMPGISKGNALKHLCGQLSISPQDVISFGDNMNDISMIEFAGTGYAVDNARVEVREAADKVIPGYVSDGVLQVLKML